MSDKSLPQLTRLTVEPSGSDLMHVTDVDDLTDGLTGTDKGVRKDLVLASVPTYQEFVTGNAVLKGGFTHTSLLIYSVYAKRWIINNDVGFGNLTATKTLSAAHATLNRFDSFIVRDTAGVFSIEVLEGTPANPASIPVPNFVTEAVIGTVYIPATATVDPNAVTELIYNEDTGSPGEWDISDLVSGQNLSNSTDPYLDTVSASFPAVATSDTVSWVKTALYTINQDVKVNFALKVPTLLASTSRIQIKLINQTSGNYWLINLSTNNISDYGFDNTNVGWQLVSIPISAFQTSSRTQTQADKIEFTFTKTPIIWMDWINTQSGTGQPIEPLEHPVKYIKVSLTAAQIKNIGTTPVEAITAPGAEKYIDIINVAANLTWGSVAYDSNSIYATAGGEAWIVSSFLGSVANNLKRATVPTTADNGLITNTAVQIMGTDSVATGDSPIDFYITYQIIEL